VIVMRDPGGVLHVKRPVSIVMRCEDYGVNQMAYASWQFHRVIGASLADVTCLCCRAEVTEE
jgi:hypothetical protein